MIKRRSVGVGRRAGGCSGRWRKGGLTSPTRKRLKIPSQYFGGRYGYRQHGGVQRRQRSRYAVYCSLISGNERCAVLITDLDEHYYLQKNNQPAHASGADYVPPDFRWSTGGMFRQTGSQWYCYANNRLIGLLSWCAGFNCGHLLRWRAAHYSCCSVVRHRSVEY